MVGDVNMNNNLPEAPISVSVTIYYRGCSIMVTKRSGEEKIQPLVEQQMALIDWALDVKGCKPSWNEDTNKKLGEKKDDGNTSGNEAWLDKQTIPDVSNMKCPRCNGPIAWSSNKNKPYCKNICWKNKSWEDR